MNYRWSVILLAGTLFAPAAMAQGPARADLSKAQQIVTQVCAACHAADGNSILAVNPVLAGQHAEYTQKQLMNFKPQDGKPAERPNAVMGAWLRIFPPTTCAISRPISRPNGSGPAQRGIRISPGSVR